MRVLITGATGFTGTALIRYLAPLGGEITGIVRRTPDSGSSGNHGVAWIQADLRDPESIADAIKKANPEALIHLAALNRGAFADLLAVNVAGTNNVLDGVLKHCPGCRTLVVSSSAVYGYPGDEPITEDCPFAPLSEYGVSKAGEDCLALMYHRLQRMAVAVARPFNIIGPGQSSAFVCGRIIEQVHEAKRKQTDTIDLAETTSCRDFIDVRDVAEGLWAIISYPEFLEKCAGKAFNLGSEKAVSIGELLCHIEAISGMKLRVRLPSDPVHVHLQSQRSDCTRIRELTGWSPRITLSASLKGMYEFRNALGKTPG
jgi:GDP-4-dehydro-6-deoxy-D-mannose reductase